MTSPAPFRPLPLGSIAPRGWLLGQLRTQADGLSGHLDEFWPDVARSRWIGGDAEGWERGPYWLDGMVPLAHLLGDERLLVKCRRWVDALLAGQHPDGWMGPKDETHSGVGQKKMDPWPQFLVFKALAQWYDATGDARIVPALARALRRIADLLGTEPLQSWAALRWPELALAVAWLRDRVGPADSVWLNDLARTAARQGYDWRAHFADFRYTEKQPTWLYENHVVNHAMALKEPAARALLGDALAVAGDPAAASPDTVRAWIATLDRYHGQATGVFSGDESLAGLSPSQGTELCAVVEYLFSLEVAAAAFGADAPDLYDRLERIAFNALPATFTTDMWAHQYVQQANQAVCRLAPDGERVYTTNGPESNLFGLEPNFGCCTANMHQGWPKFAAHLWMATGGEADGGLAAVAYAPCAVTATVAGGRRVTITEETEYPFRETVRLTVRIADGGGTARFPLRLRVPAWATGATVSVGGVTEDAAPGGFHTLEREWADGDTVTLLLPMAVRVERGRYNGALTVHSGPLVFALRIGEEFRVVESGRAFPAAADYEVHPTTPWNWGLALGPEPDRPYGAARIAVQEAPVNEARPFDPATPAISLRVPARRVPGWELRDNAAAPPPDSPAPADDPFLTTVELIPYGASHLRITEFPVVADPGT